MVKKFKALSAASDSQLAETIKNSASQIWLAGLGAFAKAQEEGNKVFEALVKEGEEIQARTKKQADEKIADAAGKMAGAWDKLENVFEERVSRALSSLGVPTKKDIDKLSKRVAELTALVQKMTEEAETAEVAGEEKPAARRRATAKAAE